jgi:Cupin domain
MRTGSPLMSAPSEATFGCNATWARAADVGVGARKPDRDAAQVQRAGPDVRSPPHLRPRRQHGWHKHPGPVFILVTKGELTYYDYDDPECKGVRVPAGEGFVDDGHGHRVRNENGAPAEDISVIMGLPTGPFRSDLDPALSGYGS